MRIRPLRNNVVIKRIQLDEKTKGGIILPGTVAQSNANIGEVVAVGPDDPVFMGEIAEENKIKQGDKVIFEGTDFYEFKFDGEEVILIGDYQILAVIDE